MVSLHACGIIEILITQLKIENIIKLNIPNYSYGLRREDPSKIINKSGFFGKVSKINESFEVEMKEKP